jgi:nitrite reductase/ring-hydroxylating ferredoxin subunit
MRTLCHIDDIADNSSKSFSGDFRDLFAVKKNGKLYLYRNHCPHLGVELNWQEDQFLDRSNMLIQCFTHGALFLIENGECVSGPCLGQSLEAINYHVQGGQIRIV